MSVHNRESLKFHLDVIFKYLDEEKILSIMHTFDGTTVHIRQPSSDWGWDFVSTHLQHIEDRETETTFHPYHRIKGEENLFVVWVEKK